MKRKLETTIRNAIWASKDALTLSDNLWYALPGLVCRVDPIFTCPGCHRTGTATGTCRPCGIWVSPPATHAMVTVPALGIEVVEWFGV